MIFAAQLGCSPQPAFATERAERVYPSLRAVQRFDFVSMWRNVKSPCQD